MLADKFKAMNLQSVLVIADQVDENLYLASRNLKNVFIVEPRYADPVSLVHLRRCSSPRAPSTNSRRCSHEHRSSTAKFDEGRLMQVWLSHRVRKGHHGCRKSNAVTFKVLQNATKPEIKAAVELMFRSRSRRSVW